MLKAIRIFTVATFTMIASILAASAQDEAGWIRAEIEGQTMEWALWADQSDWFGSMESPQTWVSLYSRPNSDGVMPSTVRLDTARVENNWIQTNVDIDLFGGGGHYTTGNVGDAKLAVSEASMDGDVLILKGTFSAAMFLKESLSAEPDMTKSLLIKDAEFEVRVPPRR